MHQVEELIEIEATECQVSEVKVIVRHNHDEFSPTFSSQHSSAVDAVLECDRKYEDLFKLLDEANPPNIETIPGLDPEKEVSDDSITYHLPNVQFEQEEMFEQPVSPENPLSESDLTIPTIKGNFDGKKNVRFTEDQAEIKASDPSDSNKNRKKSNVVTYVLEEKFTGWLTCAIFHNAPEYCHFPVTNYSSQSFPCPFEIVENGAREVVYKEIAIPIRGRDVNAHAASIYLENETSFELKFTVLSTDNRNHGNKKEGKQWFFFVGPTTKEAMESGRISVFLYNKGEANLIQVMSELRDPDRPKKNKRENCASIPLPDDGTDSPRKKKVKMALSGYSKFLQTLSIDQLDTEIQRW